MIPNIKKSQVVNHRNLQRPWCKKPLNLSNKDMEYVSNYKYLGCWINNFGNYTKTVKVLTSAAGCSHGTIVELLKEYGNMEYCTFCTLYETYVLPVANYGTRMWGFKNSAPQVLQHRINDFYLGVSRYMTQTLRCSLKWTYWILGTATG